VDYLHDYYVPTTTVQLSILQIHVPSSLLLDASEGGGRGSVDG
jgi:hypothetical protein